MRSLSTVFGKTSIRVFKIGFGENDILKENLSSGKLQGTSGMLGIIPEKFGIFRMSLGIFAIYSA